jgi:hypothetical protein
MIIIIQKYFFYQDQGIKEDKYNNEEKYDDNDSDKIKNEELKILNNHIDIITEIKKNKNK